MRYREKVFFIENTRDDLWQDISIGICLTPPPNKREVEFQIYYDDLLNFY